MKSIETIRRMDRENLRSYLSSIRAAVNALAAAYSANIDGKPSDTIAQLVTDIGQPAAEMIIGSLVNVKASDGRIGCDNKTWALNLDSALDSAAAAEYLMGSADRIHPAHLDQLARAMRDFTPAELAPDGDDAYRVTAEPAPAPSTEVNEIAPDHITLSDVQMAASYSVSYTGRTVTAFVELDGHRFKVTLTGSTCGELFTAALAAAREQRTTAVDGEGLSLVISEAVPMAEKPAAPAGPDPDKQRHGEVPEKWFIGQALEGKGWKILFDGDAGKTRVIFPKKPSAAVLEAVKAAGFYWSPSMKSWNKGLTFRAYRAAEKLHARLHEITA